MTTESLKIKDSSHAYPHVRIPVAGPYFMFLPTNNSCDFQMTLCVHLGYGNANLQKGTTAHYQLKRLNNGVMG